MPTLKQLQVELSAAKAEIARPQQQNASLRGRLAQVSSATELLAANFSIVTVLLSHYGNVNPPKNDISLQILSSLHQLRLQGQLLRSLFQAKLLLLVHLAPLLHIKALNTFMFLSSAVSLSANYVADYDACISIAAVFSIYTNPDRHLVALLIHNDYESELRSQLNKLAITVRNEYDPLDPANLCDPACSKWSHQDKVDYGLWYFRRSFDSRYSSY
ncbi:hypothetical protein RMATCC62417_15801 [Rhizopus microsporus]|nr:hypothetical protein RMATCC62417_11340 [Rhizopus microsporus]CEG81623.1 hypothetical protein RMATCC62417_15801 [Rhizopus microsporus]